MVRNEWTDAERRNAGCPSMAALCWVLHTDGSQVGSRQNEEGCAVLRPPQFLLSAFCFPNFGFTEPSIRAILSCFEIFRVNSSSAFTIQHSKLTIISIPSLRSFFIHHPTPIPVKVNKGQLRQRAYPNDSINRILWWATRGGCATNGERWSD